ncbi:SAF domain-containing protein [Arthrobacter pascens]|uniref:SAF domain-containing protein n=1 Tax=Arthrobacter pascens TaxID=1677 RepID=UPI00196A61AC|nr:SAF domain-containing protein [Arthrobacter pascens]MBN3500013.1 hypothetical protein [Arthrobacter pascens]MDR6556226.1 hypothetical protein [Arthrobacter pascens]
MSSSAVASGARLKKPSWKDPRLLVGVLLILASVVGVISLLGSADKTTEVFVAREAIAVGEKLSPDNVSRVKVRLGEVESHYITAESGMPDGLVAVQRIGKDQLLPRESLGAVDVLDRKPVAVTVQEALPEQAVAGTRVDVWVSMPDARNGFAQPKLLLPGAEIAQVSPGSTALGSSKSTVLMVLVGDEHMPSLLGAQANDAKISVVWNPGGAPK